MKFSIPIEFIIDAATQKESEQSLEGFLRFASQCYFKRFNIDDWCVVGETFEADNE